MKKVIFIISLLLFALTGCNPATDNNTNSTIRYDFTAEIATSEKMTAVAGSYQSCSFYAVGRYWIFYVGDNSYRYSSSEDGEVWAEPLTLVDEGQCEEGEHFDLAYDGEYLHIVYAFQSYGFPIRYFKGIPNEDGEIYWETNDIVLERDPDVVYMMPTIAVDQTGEVYIAYWLKDEHLSFVLPVSQPNEPILVGDYESYTTQLVFLDNGNLYTIYYSEGKLKSRVFDGVIWLSPEVIAIEVNDYSRFSVATDGEWIYIAYLTTYPKGIVGVVMSETEPGYEGEWLHLFSLGDKENYPFIYMSMVMLKENPTVIYINAPFEKQINYFQLGQVNKQGGLTITGEAIVANSISASVSGDILTFVYAIIGEDGYSIIYETRKIE